MLSCLRSVDAQVLTNQEFSAVNLTLHADPFPPIVDGLFAVESPGSLGIHDLKSWSFPLGPRLVFSEKGKGAEEAGDNEFLTDLALQLELQAARTQSISVL